MSRSIVAAVLCLLLALNLAALGVNLSREAKATVAGMKSQDLSADQDFAQAVRSVVEKCKVNVDIGKLQC